MVGWGHPLIGMGVLGIAVQPNSNQASDYLCGAVSPVASTMVVRQLDIRIDHLPNVIAVES